MIRYFYLLLFVFFTFNTIFANQIDIGIFESQTIPDQIEVKIRPDFNIQANETVTAILYTVRWNDPSISITAQYIYPFFVAPQGAPVEYNDYYYQVFAAVPMIAIPMNANEEYLVSSFTYTNGECANFEIIEDEWTQSNNGNVYLEFIGVEVTGIIYEPDVSFGSTGGIISGNDTIFFGNTTGPLNLYLYNGNILTWQRKINNGNWYDIPGTTGLDVFEETPTGTGLWKYRVKVQYNSCPEVFSDSLELIVVTTIELNLKIYLEGPYNNLQMSTMLNSSGLLPLLQPYNIPPWYYSGGENVSDIPNTDIVDWILVEIRETEGDASSATNEKTVDIKAGFLLNNGQITDITGSNKLTFTSAFIVNHFIIIWHRNHLGIISSQPISVLGGIYSYDFTIGSGQVLGESTGYIELESNIWGLAAGDSNGDQIVNMSDKVDSWESYAGLFGYFGADLKLDGQVYNQDKNDIWLKNLGVESQVP